MLRPIAILTLVLLAAGSVSAEGRRRVVLILAPGVKAREFLQELRKERWSELRSGSATGLLNVSTPGPDRAEASYLSLGAGRRLSCPPSMPSAFFVPYEDDVSTRGGRSLLLGYTAHPIMYAWLRVSVYETPECAPGTLAQVLRESGHLVAYLGPVRRTSQPKSYSPLPFSSDYRAPGRGLLTTMDVRGDIPLAAMTPNHGNFVSDWSEVGHRLLRRADLLVMDLEANTTPEFVLETAAKTSRQLNPGRDLLCIAGPSPGEHPGGEWRSLSSVLLWGNDWAGQRLTSPTTRTPDLLSNVDIAPTLLAHFGLKRGSFMEGHAAMTLPGGGPGDSISLERHTFASQAARNPGLISWGVLALAAAAFSTYLALREAEPRKVRVATGLSTSVVAGAIAMLLSGAIPVRSPAEVLSTLVGMSAVMTILAACGRRWTAPLTILLPLLAGIVVTDLFTGGALLARNLLANMPHDDARFYGIGTECFGMLIASLLLSPFLLIEGRSSKSRRVVGWCFTVLWIAAIVGVGMPERGANYGGALSLAIGGMVAVALFKSITTGERTKPGFLVLGVVLVVLAGLGLIAASLVRDPAIKTPLGEMAANGLAGGWRAIGRMVASKAILNVQMALSPYYMVGLIAFAPIVSVCYHGLGTRIRKMFAKRPFLRAGLLSTQIGSIAAVILVDTGVIAWALASVACLLVLLHALLEEVGCMEAARGSVPPTLAADSPSGFAEISSPSGSMAG